MPKSSSSKRSTTFINTNAALALSSTALPTAQDESEEQITTKAKILLIQISLLKKGGK